MLILFMMMMSATKINVVLYSSRVQQYCGTVIYRKFHSKDRSLLGKSHRQGFYSCEENGTVDSL